MNHQGLNNLRKFIGPSILILAGSFMLHLSWLKWPDLLIDYGRELYVPWQITQGKVLYADINHLYGPLSHYINAFLFQIFGTGLSTLAYFNIALVILLTFIIYNLFKSAFEDVIATAAGTCFLVIFAFSQFTGIANYNFVCPYSHEITYGIFLFFLGLLVFKKYLTEPKPVYAAAIGLILGLIFLTKVEIFLAAFGSFLCGLIFIFLRLKPHHPKKHLFSLIFFFLLPITAFFAYFSFHMPVMGAIHSILSSYTNIFIGAEVDNIFYLRISGLDNPARNMMLMLRETLGYFILFIFTGLIAYLFARVTSRILRYAGVVIIFALTFLIIFSGFFSINWMEIARAYPVLLLLLLVYLVIDLIRKREDKTFTARYLPFILLTLFSLLLLLKMILNVRLYHYGFALAMPASLVVAALLLYYVPMWISRLGNKAVAMSFTGLFIFFALLFYFSLTKHIYDLKTCPVAEGRDKFLTFDAKLAGHGPIVNKALRYIDQSMVPNDTFIVMPDGVMLNYLSRRENPSRYFEFTPNFVEAMGEEKILKDISLKPPSFIILTEKDTSEHGARYFGKDYAHNIYSWIIGNYDKEILLGSEPLTGNGFGIIIARKKK